MMLSLRVRACFFGLVTLAGPFNAQSGVSTLQERGVEQVGQLLADLLDPQLKKSDPGRVFQAISQLSKMKSIAAIDDLVRLLAFERAPTAEQPDKDAYVEIHLVTTSDRYPAAGALFEIGRSALSALLGAIRNHPIGSLESENARYVIVMIFREQPAEAIQYLQEGAAQGSSAEERKRLHHALDKVEELQRRLSDR